jgi:3',5'-cyclic AMP phosphodiesterase CpdA
MRKRQSKKPPGKAVAPKPIRLLLISDVHFGALSVSPEFGLLAARHPIPAAVPMKDHLIEVVQGSGPPPEALVALGDLTSIGSPSEFKGSVAAIQEIAKRAGIDEEMVLFTFGNHDVDWRVCSLAMATEKFPKDPHYNEIGARVGDVFVKNPPGFQEGPLPGSGVFEHPDFSLFVLNSGHFCVSDQDYRHGKLGKEQLCWFEAALNSNSYGRWRILMVHHHPFNYRYPTPATDISTLEEGAELVDLAGRHGVDFVCHGHRHHPKLSTQQETSWQKPVTFFCAGSLAVNETERNNGQIPNLFHIVSFTSRLQNGGAYGNVQTFEYAASEGWRAIRNTKETPLDHVQYFGALATTTQLRDLAKALILNETNKPSEANGSIMLPAFSDLGPEMKCQPLKELNTLIKDVSLEAGWKLIGAYPEEVALMRK